MEILFSQRLEYYSIKTYKGYIPISEKDIKPKSTNVYLNINGNKSKKGRFFYSVDKKKPVKKKFVLSSLRYLDEDEHYIYLKPLMNSRFYTTNKRHLSQHYFNPLSEVSIYLTERSIVKRGNKITLKYYHREKSRNFNDKYFKEYTSIESITIDTITGNFITRVLRDDNSKRPRNGKTGPPQVFRCNNFIKVIEMIYMNRGLFNLSQGSHGNVKNIDSKLFDDIEFLSKVNEIVFNKNFHSDVLDQNKKEVFSNLIYYFIEKKKIKTPDNFLGLLTHHYPTEKFLKKNKRKLVSSILDMYGINTKSTNKLLHTNPNINILSLSMLGEIFGKDFPKYIGNIKKDNFDIVNYDIVYVNYGMRQKIQERKEFVKNNRMFECNGEYYAKDKEKENIVAILNSLTDHREKMNVISYLRDHLKIINAIRVEQPNISLNARTYATLMNEHSDYSKIYGFMKKSVCILYVHSQETIDFIEEKIKMNSHNDECLYPVILKREDDYFEEGMHMNHCVASYASKENSIIISLRTKDGHERVTSEFDIQTGLCMQSRYSSNHQVPEMFQQALNELKDRVTRKAKEKKLHWTEKKFVKRIGDGLVVETQAEEVEEVQINEYDF